MTQRRGETWKPGALIFSTISSIRSRFSRAQPTSARYRSSAQIKAPGFHVSPRRWVIERTFSWLYKCRRLAKDYERLEETVEAWIYLAMSRLMLRRLAHDAF